MAAHRVKLTSSNEKYAQRSWFAPISHLKELHFKIGEVGQQAYLSLLLPLPSRFLSCVTEKVFPLGSHISPNGNGFRKDHTLISHLNSPAILFNTDQEWTTWGAQMLITSVQFYKKLLQNIFLKDTFADLLHHLSSFLSA